MTVNSTVSSASYAGTGTTATYPYGWGISSNADLFVYTYVTSTALLVLLTQPSDYTVSGAGNQTGGTITLTAGNLPVGTSIYIASSPAQVQSLLLQQGAAFNPNDLMNAFDYLCREVQAVDRKYSGSLRISEPLAALGAPLNTSLPIPVANQVIGWNGLATSLVNLSLGSIPLVTPGTGSVTASTIAPGAVGQVTLASDVQYRVDTIAALKALTVTYNSVLVLGYYTAGDGGGGIFRWNSADATADNAGTVIIPNSAPGAGRWNRVIDQLIGYNVKWFGAKGDGVADDTAAVQACLTAGGHIWLPPGTYLCGALTCAKRIFMHGAGAWQSIIRSTVTGGTTALTINPPNTGSSNTFYRLMNFSIEPSTATNGNNGIAVVLAASCYFSNFLIDGVYIGDFGGYGLRLDNTVANIDGIFTGTVRRCWITNGINGIKIGDSLTFCENTITGRNIGLLISGLSGAREVVIVENDITCRGGALAAFSVDGMRVRNNQMEQPALAYSGPYDAFVYLSACNYAQIETNTISPGITSTPASYAIISTGAGLSNLVDKNDISKGNVYHLLVDTGQVNFVIGEFNNYDVTAVIGDSGTTTKRILNGSATYDPPSLANGVGTTTTVTVSGAALGDQVDAVSFSLDLQGIIVSGYISSANVASVRFHNGTGGVLDLASGTLRVRARKQ